MMLDALPGDLAVRAGRIVVRCQACGARRSVPIGLHTLAEFWELMRADGWRLTFVPDGAGDVMLCPTCAPHAYPGARSPDWGRGGGDG